MIELLGNDYAIDFDLYANNYINENPEDTHSKRLAKILNLINTNQEQSNIQTA